MKTFAYAANFRERTCAADYQHARQGDLRANRRRAVRQSRLLLRRLRVRA